MFHNGLNNSDGQTASDRTVSDDDPPLPSRAQKLSLWQLHKQNSSIFGLMGLGTSNFLWRMAELLYPPVIRGGGFNTVASTAFQLALPVAVIRSSIDLAKEYKSWWGHACNRRCCKQVSSIVLKSSWHFYVAYMGWDAAYEGGNLLKVDDPFAHFLKNAVLSGSGYAVGELLAQSSWLLTDKLFEYRCGLAPTTGDAQQHEEDDEQLLEAVSRMTQRSGSDDTVTATSQNQHRADTSWQAYFDEPWSYSKSFMLFFAFAFFSDVEQHIREHDDATSTALFQALFIAGILITCDQIVTGCKSMYQYCRQDNAPTELAQVATSRDIEKQMARDDSYSDLGYDIASIKQPGLIWFENEANQQLDYPNPSINGSIHRQSL